MANEAVQVPHEALQLPQEGRKTLDEAGKITHEGHSKARDRCRMTKYEIIADVRRAGFEAIERDSVYNRVAAV